MGHCDNDGAEASIAEEDLAQLMAETQTLLAPGLGSCMDTQAQVRTGCWA